MWIVGALCIAAVACIVAWNTTDAERPQPSHPWLEKPPRD
jgi:hypothetical protein